MGILNTFVPGSLDILCKMYGTETPYELENRIQYMQVSQSMLKATLNASHYDLPKWPKMLVEGPAVDPGFAAEVIIKTMGYRLYTNDRSFKIDFYNALGIRGPGNWIDTVAPDLDAIEALHARIGHVGELYYITNHQVASSYVGKTDGWMHWDGRIDGRRNVGKWPSPIEIFEEWRMVTDGIPELDLKIYLFDVEDCMADDSSRPVLHIRAHRGSIWMTSDITDEIWPEGRGVPVQDRSYDWTRASETQISVEDFMVHYNALIERRRQAGLIDG